ncbi:acyl-CoA transferase [Sesbania bispinosa]|nr:acyl-CoA transferase [Sesbania bispinosa]
MLHRVPPSIASLRCCRSVHHCVVPPARPESAVASPSLHPSTVARTGELICNCVYLFDM